MLRGLADTEWFFAYRRPLKVRLAERPLLRASLAVRQRPDAAPALLFTIMTPKKNIRQAHDRKKLRRWALESLRNSPELADFARNAEPTGLQFVLGLAMVLPPGAQMNWPRISREVTSVAKAMLAALRRNLPRIPSEGVS